MGKKFEYKNIRFRFNVSNDITQEFAYLDIDGKRVKKMFDNDKAFPTLPALLNAAGADGWELVSHSSINSDHYLFFKREIA